MKKIFSIFAALTLSVGLWAETVSYLYPVYNDPTDVTKGIKEWKTTTVDANEITNTSATLAAGWYVVKGTDVQTGGLTCQGAVHIILANNAKLTATGNNMQCGINVTGTNSLTIYAQSTGTQMGQLEAEGGNAAGIGGGGMMEDGSNITINGGIVTANGGMNAAGIGGGSGAEGKNITINGGNVTANGNQGGAGIGGGMMGSGSNITINGGNVTANGDQGGAGIGGGGNGSGSNITINGGEVAATGGMMAAGIGGGVNGIGSNITILAGKVTANGGMNADGIGGGGAGSNIFVATSLQVKADNNNPPTTVITNTGADLASSLAGQQYVTIEIGIPSIKAAAIAEINAAIDGVTDEAILAIATTAITNINNATTKDDINSIKTQALADIAAAIFAKYKADAIAEIQTAGQGIQNTEMNNWINGAITDINAAGTDTKEKVDNIKNQILPMIQLFQDGKAEGYDTGYDEGEAAVRAELPTEGYEGPAVIITKGEKVLTLFNPEKVEYQIVEAD